ncbi:MAG: multidrug efflux SMR transporter [Marinifilaceae bacterium]|jgi:quaternary ammonium compound-resistance protein SugE
MSWVLLIFAGLFEVGFTTCLKLSEGFSKLWPSVGFVIFSAISFILLNKVIKVIPLGTAYAVWTGIGAVGTVLLGILVFKESAEAWKLFFIFLLIGSIVGLKMVSAH